MHKYELIVYWSAEDDAFVVEVPELPGCMAHGATPAEAVASAQEAIALWLDTNVTSGATQLPARLPPLIPHVLYSGVQISSHENAHLYRHCGA
jgi:predicted RNase H-like HicB family nuclease